MVKIKDNSYMEKKIILDYLNFDQPFVFAGQKRNSTLIEALKASRAITKRNIETSQLDLTLSNGHPGNWLGAIGYLTILDQIGSCFKNIDTDNKGDRENSIKYAVKSFAFEFMDNDLKKLNALIGLRHAFAHDFNLVNINQGNASQQHRYAVSWRDSNTIIILPENKWDGIISEKDFTRLDNITFANLYGLGNMVENIYRKLIMGVTNDKVTIQTDIKKMINKYTFMTN